MFCYVNEVTFGPPPKDGGQLPGEPTKNIGLEFSVPPPDLQGGGSGWRLNQTPVAHI